VNDLFRSAELPVGSGRGIAASAVRVPAHLRPSRFRHADDIMRRAFIGGIPVAVYARTVMIARNAASSALRRVLAIQCGANICT